MKTLFTIGHAGISAEKFFEPLRNAGVRRVADIRLRNSNNLLGFTRRLHLEYLVGVLLNAEYAHITTLAPSSELLDAWRRERIDWPQYEAWFASLLHDRRPHEQIPREFFEKTTAFLCKEASPEFCHRRLVAEYFKDKYDDLEIVHL